MYATFCLKCGEILGWADTETALAGAKHSIHDDIVLQIADIVSGDPVVVTTTDPHLLLDGDKIQISGVPGAFGKEINTKWDIRVIDKISFELVGSETVYQYKGGGSLLVKEDSSTYTHEVDDMPFQKERDAAQALLHTSTDPQEIIDLSDALGVVIENQKSALVDVITDKVVEKTTDYALVIDARTKSAALTPDPVELAPPMPVVLVGG